ncbi:ribbon-helix-helix domain-containing protein [Niallia alba]|uniref:ribbon-helix-helix domain-containing protein n=1 Tax=Niallia alba TaxID=2729105 RepID=UPI002E20B894|nr:ribbon-helix-helix domain-containing protein [Niallia alba]
MAKKVLKNRSQITSTLRNELYDQLKELSNDTDIPISKLLDQAVELLFEKRGIPRNKSSRNIGDNLIETGYLNVDEIIENYSSKKDKK